VRRIQGITTLLASLTGTDPELKAHELAMQSELYNNSIAIVYEPNNLHYTKLGRAPRQKFFIKRQSIRLRLAVLVLQRPVLKTRPRHNSATTEVEALL